MQKQSQQPSNSAAQRRSRKVKAPQKLEFSKQLTIADICIWIITVLLLLIVMLVQPELAPYCVNIFNVTTAAYVSLRLGYTAKAGVENYKKIAQSYQEVSYGSYEESNG